MALNGITERIISDDPATLADPPVGTIWTGTDATGYWEKDANGTITRPGGGGGAYFKAEVLINSGSVAASVSDEPVPGLTYTIPAGKDGNYVFYSVISVDIGGTDMKPMSIMLFKNGVKETDSVTMDFAKKNENQSIQLTYAMDGLVATDVIAVYVNNDNEDINTIIVGRILAQKFA